MGLETRLWGVAWAIMIATLLLTLVFATALSNHLVVFDGSKTDLSMVLLAAATVVLTGVAILIAVMAIWGFDGLRKAIVESAAARADVIATDVARSVAQTVATRVIIGNSEATSAEEAREIADIQ